MKLLKQPSFRRIMLLRVLLVSIPILLIGVAVAFRKTRTSLLYSAHQNLTESAIHKSISIQSSIQTLQLSLVAASEAMVLRTGDLNAAQHFLEDLSEQIPAESQCLNLFARDDSTIAPVPAASTCNQHDSVALASRELSLIWPQDRSDLNRDRFYIQSLDVDLNTDTTTATPKFGSSLNLVIQTPIYNSDNELRYILEAHIQLPQVESGEPGSLLGYTMIVKEDGTILAHPFPEQVGESIYAKGDAEQFNDILSNSLENEQNVRSLFDFAGDRREWLAGFSTIDVSVNPTQDETWFVFAVTPLENALYGLQAIKRILLMLTAVLTAAHLFAMLYTARDLARPIEQLGQYAQHIQDHNFAEMPKDFRIREINQLATVLENMVSRLEERASELKTAWQEAEAANQLKNEFLANTSHELRTPLNAIIGCIRLIKDDYCDDRNEELDFLDKADEAAIHLLKVINDLLDIAKIEAGTLSLTMEEVDVSQILSEVINLQTVEAHQKGLWLRVPYLLNGFIVRADAAKLKQVFLNIIYNAIKFTDSGGITITLHIESLPKGLKPTVKHHSPLTLSEVAHTLSEDSPDNTEDSPDDNHVSWIIVSIADTGIGIDPSQQHKLFRPFVMVDGSTTRKFEGTGLGLAISRNLVELMGGTITLHSEGEGLGTIVDIALPITQFPATDDANTERVNLSKKSNFTPIMTEPSAQANLGMNTTKGGQTVTH